MEALVEEQARGGGEAPWSCRKLARSASKRCRLFCVLGIAGEVGAGELGEDQCELEGAEQLRARRKRLDLGLAHAEPVHAGVDLDGGGERLPDAPAIAGPLLASA